MATIIERFQAQSISASIHRQFGGPLERQCNCLRSQNGHSAFVDLFKKPGQEKAYYKGLQTCGSVYSCPICATKITEYRKNEIETLLEKTQGKFHYLITLTIPHYIYDNCKNVRDKFIAARRRLKNWGEVQNHTEFVPYKKLMEHYQYDGSITTVEVTHGQNGWHIHSHELVILDKRVEDLREFRNQVFANWTKSLLYSGVEIQNPQAFFKRSVRIDELKGDHTNVMTSYLTKIANNEGGWGVTHELSKGNLKSAQNGNTTPFGMLYEINNAKNPEEKKRLYNKYAGLFYEYCKTFKGKQYIHFSKGLKFKYKIKDLKDEEIVNVENLLEDFYGYFEPKTEWQEIKKYRLRGWIIENSDQEWEQLIEKLNIELQTRKTQHEATKNKTFYRKTG